MNADFRIAVGFFTHHKSKKLKRRIGAEGLLCLLQLWAYAAAERPDGNLCGMSSEDIEIAADWTGTEGGFVAALQEVGFLDGDEGGMLLHDWKEHNSWASEADDRSDQARLSKLATVNREAYENLKAAGVTGIGKEEYENLKASRRSSDGRSTVAERSQNERRAFAERSQNERRTNANELYNSFSFSCSRRNTGGGVYIRARARSRFRAGKSRRRHPRRARLPEAHRLPQQGASAVARLPVLLGCVPRPAAAGRGMARVDAAF